MKKLIFALILMISMLLGTELSVGITGNNRGLLTPCGCTIPSGGLARISSMLDNIKGPHIRIAAGNQFFHHTPMPKEDQIFEQQKAAFQASMFSELEYDVINIGQFDLCYGLNVLKSIQNKFSLPFISANILDMDDNRAFPAYKIIETDDVSVMFIGICLLSDGHNFKIADPLKSLIDLKDSGIFSKADLVILLADTPAKMLSDYVKDHDGIDIIIGSKEHAFTKLPIHYKNTALVQLGSQGKYFGQLDITFKENDMKWVDITPNRHAIDAAQTAIKENREIAGKFQKQLRRQRKKLRSKLKKNPNYYNWHMTLLDNSIKDDPKIKKRVEEYTPYP